MRSKTLYLLFYYPIYFMIPQRLELQTYPYQKYALPIKLRNLK